MQVKCVVMTDNPNFQTGQAIIHRNICQGLISKGFEVASIGWGDFTSKSICSWPVYVTSKENYFGESIFDQVIQKERPDIVITIGDIWNFHYVVNSQLRKYFQWIGYTAVDGEVHNGGVPPTWIPTLNDMDRIVAYTQYGKNAILKSYPIDAEKISVIPHGVDLSTFFPFTQEQKEQCRIKYGIPNDVLIYLLVARNQMRKNIPEIIKTWAEFTKDGKHPKALLWPHMLFRDTYGNNLNEVIKICKIEKNLVFFDKYANAQSNLDTVSVEMMNELYGMSDVVLLLSGEGWGFPLTEAMACAKPIIALNHSACAELVGDIGELVNVKGYITGVHSTERPLIDQEDLLAKLDMLYYDDALRIQYGKLGAEKSLRYSWTEVHSMWGSLLHSVVDPFSASKINLERIS